MVDAKQGRGSTVGFISETIKHVQNETVQTYRQMIKDSQNK